MPESKSRKKDKDVYTPPPEKRVGREPVRVGSARWVAPAMVAFFILGLIWIVAYYVAPEAPFIGDLRYWNVLIGFVLIGIGFVISTRWK
ncbi:MAG: cell division protein CrgA [Candidatus Nanopelagicales bacterium]|nr:cell division protein CrgA [Candidatus Nanopelagicales bacterium]